MELKDIWKTILTESRNTQTNTKTYMPLWKNLDSDSRQEFSKMVKSANQRMREIEKQGLQNQSNWYQYIQRIAFDGNKAFTIDSKGRVKLRTDFASITNASTMSKIKDVVDYTHNQGQYSKKTSNTSTITGIKAKYKKQYESYKKTTGSTIDYNTFIDVWKVEGFKELVKAYGYSEVMSMIAETTLPMEEAIQLMLGSKDVYSMREKLGIEDFTDMNGELFDELDFLHNN